MVGSAYLGNGRCIFSVWAPEKKSMQLHIVSPGDRIIPMIAATDGYFTIEVEGVLPGARYFFRPDNNGDLPDPASQSQPEGVHGASAVLDHRTFLWSDHHWKGLPFENLILYEIHVGTFTSEGTFEAIIPRLDDLVDLGVNAIEIMPVSQFPGKRNWGYDGVFPYAVQNSYGGANGLKKLVDACHRKDIAVFLDVVYNHIGPEGNYFREFGPYFTKKYNTPWGDAINMDTEWADGVRDFFSDNAVYWFENFHIDGLRLDAIHTVFDSSAIHFWELLQQKITTLQKKTGRIFHTIAESDLNSPRVVQPVSKNGFGFTAQWLDDFHHALYVLLDPKGKSRYFDFGKIEQLAKAYTDGFVHSGEYVYFRKRKYGASSAGIAGNKFVVFNANHDQAGNRVKGERLSMLVDFERLKLAAAAMLLAPYIPMLFMGEEYGDDAPFFYFVDHSDQHLIEAVRKGRREEFAAFKDEGDPRDPQDEKTFLDSTLHWCKRTESKHAILLQWHKTLIALRQTTPALQNFDKKSIHTEIVGEKTLVIQRTAIDNQNKIIIVLNFSEQSERYTIRGNSEIYRKTIDSKESEWMMNDSVEGSLPEIAKTGSTLTLPPCSAAVYEVVDERLIT